MLFRSAVFVEVVDHLLERGDTAREGADEIVLAAAVDADVGIALPDEDTVDAAVAFGYIFEIAVDGVLARDLVIEEAVFGHHLRLHEAGLGPLKFGALVFGGVVAGADAVFVAPVEDFPTPFAELSRASSELIAARRIVTAAARAAGPGFLEAVGDWDQAVLRRILGILRVHYERGRYQRSRCQKEESMSASDDKTSRNKCSHFERGWLSGPNAVKVTVRCSEPIQTCNGLRTARQVF